MLKPIKNKIFKRGGEVLIPHYVYHLIMAISSVWLKPKFVDIDLETLNISIDLKKDYKKNKSVDVNKCFGISSDLFEIKKIAKKHNDRY